MEKSHKMVLVGLGVVLAAIIISSFFGQSNIRAIQNNISLSQRTIDSALNDIKVTRNALDSIQANIGQFKVYVANMQTDVEQLNETKEASEAKSNTILKEIRKKATVLKDEALRTDTLPSIKIKPL